ncbi:hypothetical protein D9M68_946220 [compost metagenome]
MDSTNSTEVSITPACTTGKSRANTASTTVRPTPGQAKMTSTTKAPPSIAAKYTPRIVTSGIAALRSAYFHTSTPSGRSMARPMRM